MQALKPLEDDKYVFTLYDDSFKIETLPTEEEKQEEDPNETADYIVDEKARTVTLTARGVAKAEQQFGLENLADPENTTLSHHINQAIRARGLMKRDIDYVVKDGEVIEAVSLGDGPIDSSFKSIESVVGKHYELDDFRIQAVTEGREAMGESIVKLIADGKVYSGRGISTDIVESSIRAYINALNKIAYEEQN